MIGNSARSESAEEFSWLQRIEYAAEVNPYASPASVGGYELDFGRGGGVWRDGDRLVIHKDAELPRVCLITGEPARIGYPLEIVWRQGAISTRRLRLHAPLSGAIHRRYRRRRWAAI